MQTVRNKQNQLIEFNEMHVRGSVYKDELVLRVDDKIACFHLKTSSLASQEAFVRERNW